MNEQLAPAPWAHTWGTAADDTPLWMVERRRRRLRLVVGLAVVVVTVIAAAAFLALRARANYLDGKAAFAAGSYSTAIADLGNADIAGVPYADAHELLQRVLALSLVNAENAALLQNVHPTSASRDLRRAVRLFGAGRYDEAVAAVPTGQTKVPLAVLGARPATGGPAMSGLLLLVAAERDLAAGKWAVAAAEAQLVLARAPDCRPALLMMGTTGHRELARPKMLRAERYAAVGYWRLAARYARAALRLDPTYPGAAALLARAEANITKRSRQTTPAATSSSSSAGSTSSSTSSGTTTQPSNPAPPVPSKPTPPPP